MRTWALLSATLMCSACITGPRLEGPAAASRAAVPAGFSQPIRTEAMDRGFYEAHAEEGTARIAASVTDGSVDILALSGGGAGGAYGAGILVGLSEAGARPRYEIVTGVSTGALIAPFAFLGDEPSIERIVQLYRNPEHDVAVSRGWFFFMPHNPSFFVLPGLERALGAALDRPMIERIAAAEGTGRFLLVNTTNIDLGDMHAWDVVAEAKRSLAGKSDERVRSILLASAGIPAVFPARGIGDYLYVDGAITGNILYGGRAREEESLLAMWRAKHPQAPMPRLRYWVIFNNQVRFPPQVVPHRWPDIMNRATIMATQTSTLNSMRHLFALAELARLKYRIDVEVRFLAVPDEWVPSKPGSFVPEVMNDLADLGEKMGADPNTWRTESP